VPRDRNGGFEPKVLPRYQRREEKLDRQILDLFIGGISTRKMKKITKELLGKGYSAGTISKINKQLTEEMRAWMQQPIEDNIQYIFLDGLNLPVKRFAVSKESLLVAIGITTDGYRKILAVQLGDRESAGSWGEFLKDLVRRGLKGEHLKMGIMDGLAGLENVFSEIFPRARIQRCVVHKLRNVAAKLPRRIHKDCLDHLKRIFYAKDLEAAQKRFQEWKQAWEKMAPSAVHCLEKDLETVLSFYTQPQPLWKVLRTTNTIERTFKEFRKQTKRIKATTGRSAAMIIYTPDPIEFMEQDEHQNTVVFRLPSGGYITAEPCEYNKLKIISITSTDPMDYVNSKYQPGNFITMETKVESPY